MKVAADIGGTFTDVVLFDDAENRLRFGKAPTTPKNLVEGFLAAIEKAGTIPAECETVVHGSTIVINALLTRNGAKTALITTKGFRDVYEIGRANRPDSYNLFFQKPKPLVPRHLCLEVAERLRGDGSVITDFDKESATGAINQIRENGIESVAVVFLHSYVNPAHEKAMKELLNDKGNMYITASSDISREYREFERTSTTVANAFVGPMVSKYIDLVLSSLREKGFRGNLMLMQSNGGIYDSDTGKVQPIQMIESGPAGGVAGASHVCRTFGYDNAITLDVGGTTAKACVIEGGVPTSGSDYFVGGYDSGLPIRVPVVDIKEVGAGGGSIAWVNEAVSNKTIGVGPQSAGADPGPACYGKGGDSPTVTDADLVLGKIDSDNFLGGEMKLQEERAHEAIDTKVAKKLGMDVLQAAKGITNIADAAMAYAVRAVTTERGYDTRDFTLIVYGGAGPTHVAPVAEELQIPLVVVPPSPAHFSAMGMLYCDLRRDYVQTKVQSLESTDMGQLDEVYARMEAQGREAVKSSGVKTGELVYSRTADMRYIGQEHAVLVNIPSVLSRDEIKKRFDSAHLLRYSHDAPREPCEFVNFRSTTTGIVPKPPLSPIAKGTKEPPVESHVRARKMYDSGTGEFVSTPVYRREKLLAGNMIKGPSIIEEYASTTIVPTGFVAEVNGHGYLCLKQLS